MSIKIILLDYVKMSGKTGLQVWICSDCNFQFNDNERGEDSTTRNGRCPYCLSKNIEAIK
ncbi:MAG: hypothetical protein JXA91_05870 [Candidatus Thermoplasmatota archaeon]|nr:hypothetical protein [Candidatus Thermoplasmatota archaeon]